MTSTHTPTSPPPKWHLLTPPQIWDQFQIKTANQNLTYEECLKIEQILCDKLSEHQSLTGQIITEWEEFVDQIEAYRKAHFSITRQLNSESTSTTLNIPAEQLLKETIGNFFNLAEDTQIQSKISQLLDHQNHQCSITGLPLETDLPNKPNYPFAKINPQEYSWLPQIELVSKIFNNRF